MKCEVRQHSIMGGHSQRCVTKCRLLRTLTPLPPLSWPLLLPSAFSSVFINFKASRRYICRLTLDPCPGRGWRFSRRSGLPYHTFSLHTLSHVKAILIEAKARHHFKFHKPRTHDLEWGKKKDNRRGPPSTCRPALSLSLSLSLLSFITGRFRQAFTKLVIW